MSLRIKLFNKDGSLIEQMIYEGENTCGFYRKENKNFEFIPTENVVTLHIEAFNMNPGFTETYYLIDNLTLSVPTEPALAFYYDDRGHRVRKENFVYAGDEPIRDITWYVRDASGSPLAIYQGTAEETQTTAELKELPIYGLSRLGVASKYSSTFKYLYQITDHLGNVRAVVEKDRTGGLVVRSATDYYPFGMPMPGRTLTGSENYRYTYQGQEKDPETGKEAFQLRLWDGRIGRWLSPDPYHQYFSPYLGMGNNPINGIDPDGGCFLPDGSPCDDNAAIGTRVTGGAGHDWTMTDTGWTRNDGYDVFVGETTQYSNNQGGYMHYALTTGFPGHAFVVDPDTKRYWEASYPLNESGERMSGVEALIENLRNGVDKSVIRSRNLTDEDFWTYDSGGEQRSDLKVYIIYVPNKGKAIAYADKNTGNFDYFLTADNCKTFAIDVMNAGHANIPNTGPIPAYFVSPDDSWFEKNFFHLTSPDFRVNNPKQN